MNCFVEVRFINRVGQTKFIEEICIFADSKDECIEKTTQRLKQKYSSNGKYLSLMSALDIIIVHVTIKRWHYEFPINIQEFTKNIVEEWKYKIFPDRYSSKILYASEPITNKVEMLRNILAQIEKLKVDNAVIMVSHYIYTDIDKEKVYALNIEDTFYDSIQSMSDGEAM